MNRFMHSAYIPAFLTFARRVDIPEVLPPTCISFLSSIVQQSIIDDTMNLENLE